MWLKNKEEAQRRFNICKECNRFYKPTAQCEECGCLMKIKVKLTNASCPLKKW